MPAAATPKGSVSLVYLLLAFVLGIGAGWHEPEFHAFGFPYDPRVSRFEDAITIISVVTTRMTGSDSRVVTR